MDIGIQFGGRVGFLFPFFAGDSISLCECVLAFLYGEKVCICVLMGAKLEKYWISLVGSEFARYPHLYTACDQWI